MWLSIAILVVGVILILIPLYNLILSCKSASDITWTLGQVGGMKNGIIFYIGCALIGGGLVSWGIIRLFF